MDAAGIIAQVRRGEPVSDDALMWFADGLADGTVSDAQAGAFAMAVCLKGLSERERVALTLAMRDTGQVLRWDMPGPVVDKHSTGGVGDPVSLLLAPALAACGAYVPMISGRGLGHTGGTLDKLEAIPGLRVDLDPDQFRAVVRDCGAAIVAANTDIAPADKRLYAVRDVTATVESLDLIVASILSKKLAAGPEALVLDVKVGSGAFMRSMEEAEALAESLTATANNAGCRTAALISDMNEPLSPNIGNALEVASVVRALTDGREGPLVRLTAALGGLALASCGAAETAEAGEQQLREALLSGTAAEAFGRMVRAQGGPADFVDQAEDRLPSAPVVAEVGPDVPACVASMDATALGRVVVALGGGRAREGDTINPAVGLEAVAGLGTEVGPDAPFCRIHAASPEDAEAAAEAVARAFTLSDTPPDPLPLIYRTLS